MTTGIINQWKPTTLDELWEAVREMSDEARARGHDHSVVYVDVKLLALEETVLSDGSRALNLIVRENR